MSINNHWRNKQLGDSFLTQELICLDFLNKHQDLSWAWFGTQGSFFEHCRKTANIVNKNPTGLVIINSFTSLTPKQFVAQCNGLLTDSVQAVYLAINRFEFIATNDLHIDYHDSMTESIAQIVAHLNQPFKAIPDLTDEVDGRHFVGVHGLDIFTYENN